MRIFSFTFFLFIFFSCSSIKEEIITPIDDIFPNQIKSCSGRGSISSVGGFSGRLSFNFISQNDSSFCQFQDILGRKVLLLWLTQNSIDAWNLIENKKYSYSNVSDILPILSVVSPNHLIKFLWGKEITSNQIHAPNEANIEIKLGKSNQKNTIIPYLNSKNYWDWDFFLRVSLSFKVSYHAYLSVNYYLSKQQLAFLLLHHHALQKTYVFLITFFLL